MTYKQLREQYFKNTKLSQAQQLIVKGYIDYCESNNIPIKQANSALYDEDQVCCCGDCGKCATPIC